MGGYEVSVLEKDKIDAIGYDEKNKVIVLMLADHLDWDEEYNHLLLLQDKINAYISFIENEQYLEIMPTKEFDGARIEIHFKYEMTENAEKFLQRVQDQVGEIGVLIKCFIS